MNLSPYIANKIVRWFAGSAMPTAPTALYAALFDGDPLDGGTEVGGDITGGGARVEISVATPADDGEDNVVASDAIADFGASDSETEVNVTHAAIMDASTSGNFLAIKTLAVPRAVQEGDNVRVQSGDFELTIQKHTPA